MVLSWRQCNIHCFKTRSQLTVEEEPNYLWLENEIINRLVGHIELAFKAGDFKLGLDLISLFSSRILTYAQQFQFDIGIRELRKMKTIIEKPLHRLMSLIILRKR